MKNKIVIITIFLFGVSNLCGQVTTFFSENMGTTATQGAAITTHDAANRFQNSSTHVFTGSGDMRTSTTSSGYIDASGSVNVMINALNENFIISGFDIQSYSEIELSFGLRLAAASANNTHFKVYYSNSGANGPWVEIPVSISGNFAWNLFSTSSITTEIPNTLKALKFERTNIGTAGWEFRLDDITLRGVSCVKPVTPTGSILVAENCGSTTLSYTLPDTSGIKYYWQTSINGDSVLDEVTAINNTKTITANNQTWYIRAQRTIGGCWSDNSISANSGTIKISPVFTFHPLDQTVQEGSPEAENITFFADVNGGNAYNWQVNKGNGWINITDLPVLEQNNYVEFDNELLIDTATFSMSSYQYRLRVTNMPCESFSNPAQLTVRKTPPVVQSIELAYSTVFCGEVKISVTAVNTDGNTNDLNYSWYKYDSTSDSDWVLLTDIMPYNGTTTSTLTVSSTSELNGVQYYVRVHQGSLACYGASRTVRVEDKSTIWNGTSWSNGMPDITKKAIINGVYNTAENGNLKACSCEVTSFGNLTIEENYDIIIQNEVLNSGIILVKNNANLVQINNVSNSGEIRVERITRPMNNYSFTYWGAPVSTDLKDILWYVESTTNVFDVLDTTVNISFSWMPSTASWDFSQVPYMGVMNAGIGYIIKAPNSFNNVTKKSVKATFVGEPNNGDIPVTILGGTDVKNFLSNPYPSAIDIDKFLIEYGVTGSVIVPTIYLWTHANDPSSLGGGGFEYSSSDFATYTLLGGTATATGEPEPTGKVVSGQGFFVDGNTGGEVVFKNSYRYDNNILGYNNGQFFKVMDNELTEFEKHRFWLNLTGQNTEFKQTLIGYSDVASDDLDILDGVYYDGGNATNLYTILNSKSFAIQAFSLPFENSDVIPLGYKVGETGNYTVSLDDLDGLFENQDIFIKDNLLDMVHNLKDMSYEFMTESGTFENRLEVVFKPSENLNINNPDFDNNWNVYVKGKQINLETFGFNMKDVYIYDILGREIYKNQDINSNRYDYNQFGANQILIIKMISTDNKTFVRKVVH